jgi:glyoxylase-like metal-dependent hydrolase (beta-lactamase superfamily II)
VDGIHRLPIPTPFMVGRVNLYLVEDDPLTLVDTGPNSGRSLDELEQALAAHARRVEDLERIVLTHQHVDHAGLLDVLARRSGAEVCALEGLDAVVADFPGVAEADDVLAEDLMRTHGIADEVVTVLRAMSKAFRAWGCAGVAVDRVLRPGEVLEFAQRSWVVHHRPGHSPSDTVFHDVQRRMLIGGDHLLERISSVPLIQQPLPGDPLAGLTRPRALVTYLASLRATQAMEAIDVVAPGHGEPVTNAAELIDARLAMHERRAGRMLKLLADGPRTAHEIARAMWRDLALTQAYLTLCEVLGHLDLLMDDGAVAEEDRGDGVSVFRAR